jgi:hypothetical protein
MGRLAQGRPGLYLSASASAIDHWSRYVDHGNIGLGILWLVSPLPGVLSVCEYTTRGGSIARLAKEKRKHALTYR